MKKIENLRPHGNNILANDSQQLAKLNEQLPKFTEFGTKSKQRNAKTNSC